MDDEVHWGSPQVEFFLGLAVNLALWTRPVEVIRKGVEKVVKKW